jgi:hypothetical protein
MANPLNDEKIGSVSGYDLIDIPSDKDIDRLQKFALKNNVDFKALLLDEPGMPEEHSAWTKIFSLSLNFKKLDRNAYVYGHIIHGSFIYFVVDAHGGVEKYNQLLNIQTPEVRQRIKDFLFYDAAGAPIAHRETLEKKYRTLWPIIFPDLYIFGKGNSLFKPSRKGGADGGK